MNSICIQLVWFETNYSFSIYTHIYIYIYVKDIFSGKWLFEFALTVLYDPDWRAEKPALWCDLLFTLSLLWSSWFSRVRASTRLWRRFWACDQWDSLSINCCFRDEICSLRPYMHKDLNNTLSIFWMGIHYWNHLMIRQCKKIWMSFIGSTKKIKHL